MTFLLVTLCCILATLGSFLFGYDSGVIGSTLEQEAFVHHFHHPSDAATGGIVSSYNGGAILGSIAVPYICDPFGRRPVMFVGALLAALGAALQAGAVHIAMLIVGRLIAGFSIGLMSTTIPIYCSEISPAHIRGFLGAMQQWMLGLGVVVAQWVGYGCSLHTGAFSWRFPLAIQAVPAVILGIGVWFLPESPRWLIEKGHKDAAKAILNRLHLNHARTNTDLVESEFTQICESIAFDSRTVVSSWRQLLFSSPIWRRRVLLACGIQAFTQCSGTNVIQVYSPRIYRSLGLPTSTTLMITGVWGALAQFWNTVFLLFIDRVGRRKLLIPSLLGMGAALCVEATLARYYGNFAPDSSVPSSPAALRAAIAMFFVFSLFFTSLGLISWLYPAEIFPTAIRARGSSLATATNWSLNLVFAQCSPIALTTLQYKYFYCFVAFNWAAAVIVWACYPETGGKSLEEVGEVFTTGRQRGRAQSFGLESQEDVKPGVTLQVTQGEEFTNGDVNIESGLKMKL
ncbi:high-affinity glucose transporter [Aspergillus udagawae]|uniref:High-affinity glucose transporter n=1 Tax=Aspergillus udagawae TaxID=91492 RepID=A0A8H3P0C4_9EURO|nr:high-affinity glucose transporter [Aspergillus udagawae]GFF83184.1 high-affinity glucose transporter [Aspergillus udagawae]GFG19503.1 high-affinity glucose transporter [Aspergillus udagawae]GFG23551.1 high-affinity glucose transporter [Aspergillus udagawae]